MSIYISLQKFDKNLLHFTQVLVRSARTSSGSSVTQCMWYLKGVIPSEKILLLLMEVSICDTHTIKTDVIIDKPRPSPSPKSRPPKGKEELS